MAVLGCLLALGSNLSVGRDHQGGALKVENPWSRATAPGASVGAGFLVITNPGKADELVSGSSPVAERVELHSSRLEGGIMKMRKLERLEIPAGGVVRLEPGALHLMLVGLRQPLVEGTTVPLTLRFGSAGELTVQLKVEAIGAQGTGAQGKGAPAKAMDHSHH
ncbi:MAG: copper chaperone PCu(A)C [Gammaproteobacteria bacterium]|nr:copper chaperone PCu(A)C [Gammaproteobacteria bacterium]